MQQLLNSSSNHRIKTCFFFSILLRNLSLTNSFYLPAPSPHSPPFKHISSKILRQPISTSQVSAEDDPAMKEWSSMTVQQLKSELRERKLKVSGNKSELVSRLESFFKDPVTPPDQATIRKRSVEEKTSRKETLSVAKRARIPVSRPSIDESGVQPRMPYSKAGNYFSLVSWNIAGMRAFLRKEEDQKILLDIIDHYRPTMICLQETKLQVVHVPDIQESVAELFPEYTSHWTCSELRKGYSGCAVLLLNSEEQRHRAVSVTNGIGDTEGDLEGRSITVEYKDFFVTNVYVPNSGDKLKRLEYRISSWDKTLKKYMKELEERKPVILVGDLNVAHEDEDFFNPEDPKTKRQAATTPEERNSFSNFLSMGYVDTFRWKNPDAKGAYTYWSQRAQNRPFNRGLRIDYIVVSQSLVEESSNIRLFDSFIFKEESKLRHDHCPIGAVIQLPHN